MSELLKLLSLWSFAFSILVLRYTNDKNKENNELNNLVSASAKKILEEKQKVLFLEDQISFKNELREEKAKNSYLEKQIKDFETDLLKLKNQYIKQEKAWKDNYKECSFKIYKPEKKIKKKPYKKHIL